MAAGVAESRIEQPVRWFQHALLFVVAVWLGWSGIPPLWQTGGLVWVAGYAIAPAMLAFGIKRYGIRWFVRHNWDRRHPRFVVLLPVAAVFVAVVILPELAALRFGRTAANGGISLGIFSLQAALLVHYVWTRGSRRQQKETDAFMARFALGPVGVWRSWTVAAGNEAAAPTRCEITFLPNGEGGYRILSGAEEAVSAAIAFNWQLLDSDDLQIRPAGADAPEEILGYNIEPEDDLSSVELLLARPDALQRFFDAENRDEPYSFGGNELWPGPYPAFRYVMTE